VGSAPGFAQLVFKDCCQPCSHKFRSKLVHHRVPLGLGKLI
jgi:hypothetical protein